MWQALFVKGMRYLGMFVAAMAFLTMPLAQAQSVQLVYTGLDQASSLYLSPNAIYVVEQGKHRLLKLDLTGKLIDTIGGKGSGDYQFSKPIDVDATNGLKVYVSDFNNRRVQVFDRRGQYLSSLEGTHTFGERSPYEPTQIAIGVMGELFVLDASSNYIRHFDLDANLLDEFRIPAEVTEVNDLEVTSRELYMLDKKSQTIHRSTLNGQYLGFYPADGIQAFCIHNEMLWLTDTKGVLVEKGSKERVSIPFGKSLQPLDIQVSNGLVYILTAEALFSVSIPKP